MIKAVLENGIVRPLDPFPSEWQEGQALVIEAGNADDSEAISAWAQEIEEAANEIPAEEHETFLEALAEHKRAAKEAVLTTDRDFEALPKVRTQNWATSA